MEHTEEDTVPLHRPDAPGWSPFAPPELNRQYAAPQEPHRHPPEAVRNPRSGDHVPSAPPPAATPMPGAEAEPVAADPAAPFIQGSDGWPAPPQPTPPQAAPNGRQPDRLPVPVFPDHTGALERVGVTADDFSSRRVVPPRPPVAETGLRGALHRLSLGVLALPPGPRETARNRAVETVRRNFGGLRQITVVNPKGGAGKTVAVLMLAMTFGRHRGGYVLAWDNNETQGTLGMRAQQDFHVRTVRDLLRDLDHFRGPTGRIGDLSQYVRAQGGAMFDVLASDESATAGEMLTSQAFGDLREAVSRFYKLIVVDTGNNVRAANWQAAIDATDQLVVTMSARNDSAETAARMLDHLEQTGRRDLVRGAVSVVSMPAHRKDVDLPAVQRHFAARTRAVLLAPYEKLLDSGEPIRYDSLSKASSGAWLRISSAVAEGL
ncbi:MinD-like ATPase involved in chromosome partitioning or flagellar assembly [Glycomyces harbinensis]|uniref:MinD-like ATPase involved in chromosome partitioning or flagellar assembly n=1 Tax=Glycomyces harbinensis TaxID=58114 RepID=A0A1G7DA24_9ACTN|nr:chromosome partitioning protein [Glycomyces harbinensis]SDE47595.1 MinD-like ATPase involved in chromosome partitioning or flagellar assembly [Glycomyces harbinensis]